MVNVGVVIPNPLPAGMALPDIARLARTAETAGLDGVWAEDGLASGDATVLDLMCVLAACAAASEKIEVGSAIFAPSLRNLSWALKQVATVQLLARGRLQLGVALGAAGDDVYGLAGLSRSGQRERTDEFLGLLAAARDSRCTAFLPVVPGQQCPALGRDVANAGRSPPHPRPGMTGHAVVRLAAPAPYCSRSPAPGT